MSSRFPETRIAIIGGDAREAYLAESLAGAGFFVQVFGPRPPQRQNIVLCETLRHALEGARAAILPAPGINEKGELYCPFLEKPLLVGEGDLGVLPRGTPVFVGVAGAYLKNLASRLDLKLIELLDLDEVAILNSIPTAEGAVWLAMGKVPVTIHGSRCFVLGFGRTGQTLAALLAAMGAQTTVVARNPAQRARALQMNCRACDFTELPELVGNAEIIFNTVPALVLDEKVLARVSPEALIVDLASSPGGVDFAAAGRLGLTAFLAPGLPGKIAPKTAGQILSRVIGKLLAEYFA